MVASQRAAVAPNENVWDLLMNRIGDFLAVLVVKAQSKGRDHERKIHVSQKKGWLGLQKHAGDIQVCINRSEGKKSRISRANLAESARRRTDTSPPEESILRNEHGPAVADRRERRRRKAGKKDKGRSDEGKYLPYIGRRGRGLQGARGLRGIADWFSSNGIDWRRERARQREREGVAVGVKGGCHAGSPGKVIDRVSPEEKRSGEDSRAENTGGWKELWEKDEERTGSQKTPGWFGRGLEERRDRVEKDGSPRSVER
ncbi:hypothetical protein WN55_08927 [Dufourea novaeangliae]|uniref:Uncharacterized protein n=1 Tax=Dufourea novaeangliae TaxID=178035 RepID=A0A154P5B0_DUFNO|nr:hypothetical protein WN55_08927 [Dufourea novaeangliae]